MKMNKTKKDIRVLTIVKCEDCSNCIFDDNRVRERWGKYYCVVLEKIVSKNEIDKKCPLPKYEGK